MFTKKSKTAVDFHDKIADKWTSKNTSLAFNRRLLIFKELIQSESVAKSFWLDAGCGSGIITRILGRIGCQVIGLDASMEMIKRANCETVSEDGIITYELVESIENIPELDCVFNGIICSSVVEYIPNYKQVIFEFNRVLKNDGTLIISFANKKSLHRFVQKSINKFCSLFNLSIYEYILYSKSSFSEKEILSCLRECNFRVIQVVHFSPSLSHELEALGCGSLIIVKCTKINK